MTTVPYSNLTELLASTEVLCIKARLLTFFAAKKDEPGAEQRIIR